MAEIVKCHNDSCTEAAAVCTVSPQGPCIYFCDPCFAHYVKVMAACGVVVPALTMTAEIARVPRVCYSCQRAGELRPIGPHNALICAPCALDSGARP